MGRTNSPTSARRGDGLGYIRIWATPPKRLVFWDGAPSPSSVHERAQEGAVDRPGRPTDKGLLSVGRGRPGRSTVALVGRLAGRPTGAFDFPFRIQIPFLDGIESNLGFHKSRDSVAINRG